MVKFLNIFLKEYVIRCSLLSKISKIISRKAKIFKYFYIRPNMIFYGDTFHTKQDVYLLVNCFLYSPHLAIITQLELESRTSKMTNDSSIQVHFSVLPAASTTQIISLGLLGKTSLPTT